MKRPGLLLLMILFLSVRWAAGEGQAVCQIGGKLSGLAWSPDGSFIACVDMTTGGGKVWIAGVGKGGADPAGPGVAFSWRPDSSGLLVEVKSKGKSYIEEMPLSTRERTWICEGSAPVALGSGIAFVLEGKIWVRPAKGKSLLLIKREWNTPLVFPGAAGKILFTGDGALYTTQPKPQSFELLLQNKGLSRGGSEYFKSVQISPDGRHLLISSSPIQSDSSVKDAILICASDGSGKRLLTNGRGFSWAPDSRRFAFCAKGRVRIYDIEKDRRKKLTRAVTVKGMATYRCPAWSPDGKTIAAIVRSRDTNGDGLVDWRDGEDIVLLPAPGSE